MAPDRVGGKVVGDAAGLEARLDAAQRLDHFGTQIARQQRQHVLAAHFGAQRQQFRREQLVERLDIQFGPLELGPGILVMIERRWCAG